ncbi:MAG: acetolactate synthase large subunit [Pseudomonadota bacterium]
MNGAESLVETFLANDLDLCFANPGTSEMHFVAALDGHPDMRCVLCLFEGGTSGAADGYYRMTGKVAATMLHLAPGFGNAYANLHNAKKAGSGVVNVMGDHATYHNVYDSPLKGDTIGVSQAVSHWTRASATSQDVARDGAAAIAAARSGNGQISTLILPADTAWGDGGAAERAQPAPLHRPDDAALDAAAAALKAPGAALFVGGPAAHDPLLPRVGQIAAASGARITAPLFLGRIARGAGTPMVEQLPYRGELAQEVLKDITHLICIGTTPPVNFFAYPGQPSVPSAPGCQITELCRADMDVTYTLDALADRLGATNTDYPTRPLALPDAPADGALTADSACAVIARWLPDRAVVVNEAVTSGLTFPDHSLTARPFDLLTTVGGAIGGAMPNAVGAAIGCPDRHVVAMIGDGSAMYTIQSLWTMTREALDVTVVIFANRSYRILHFELMAMGFAAAGRNAQRMFDLENPTLDWCALAQGHGVPAIRVETTAELTAALEDRHTTPGPRLIEVIVP